MVCAGLARARFLDSPFQIVDYGSHAGAVTSAYPGAIPPKSAFPRRQRPGEHTLPIRFADDLREIDLGVLHGEPHTVWRSAIAGDPMSWRPEGGESWLDVQSRATRYLHEVVLANGDRDILIVAHGGVNRGLIASLLGLAMGDTWLPAGVGAPQHNTCVNRFELDDAGQVVSAHVNDTRHLEGELENAGSGQRWNSDSRCWDLLGAPEESVETAFLAP